LNEPRHRLRILHLSDLHERGPRESEPWRRRRVLGDAWMENLGVLIQDGPIDLVCFTGDAADWGLAEEYAQVTDFLNGLLARLNLGKDRLFVIPGNHDIERPIHKDVWSAVREAAFRADPLDLARWMAGGKAPLGFEDGWRDRLLERQAAYRSWVRDGLGRPDLDPAASPHGLLGYRREVRLPDLDAPIHLIGLDTAWLCGDDNDAGKLRMTDAQLGALATDEKGNALPGFRLVLMHHPFHELADGADLRRRIAPWADLVLRGHLHEPEVETWADPDRTVRQLAAGCLYEGHRADQYPNACHVLTVGLDDAGRPERIDLRFRSFSSRGGHWFDDNSLYKDSQDGRLTWTFSLPVRPTPNGNPYKPWTEATPPRFVGRTDLLRRLEAALEEGRCVSLVGDWRIGKSSLLRTFFEKQSGRGREVRLLTGEGPEGVSPRALVERVTGSSKVGEGADEAADALDRWLASVGRPSLVPLLLIDEFDGMVPRFDHRFLERLRGMMGRVALVLSTRREIDLIYQELSRTSPFQNKLELAIVGLLEPADAEELIRWGEGILAPGDADLLRRWAGRHPFYLQLLGAHLVEARRQGEPVERAMDRFRMEASARLRELWGALGDKDRRSLAGVLEGRPVQRLSLRAKGVVTNEGQPFAEILAEWLREEIG
jgi:hypothetical protein